MNVTLMERVNKNDARIGSLETRIDNLREQNVEQEARIKTLESELATATARKIELELELAAHKEQLAERLATIARLQAQLRLLGHADGPTAHELDPVVSSVTVVTTERTDI